MSTKKKTTTKKAAKPAATPKPEKEKVERRTDGRRTTAETMKVYIERVVSMQKRAARADNPHAQAAAASLQVAVAALNKGVEHLAKVPEGDMAKRIGKGSKPKYEVKVGAVVSIKPAARGEYTGLVDDEDMERLRVATLRGGRGLGKASCQAPSGGTYIVSVRDLEVIEPAAVAAAPV